MTRMPLSYSALKGKGVANGRGGDEGIHKHHAYSVEVACHSFLKFSLLCACCLNRDYSMENARVRFLSTS